MGLDLDQRNFSIARTLHSDIKRQKDIACLIAFHQLEAHRRICVGIEMLTEQLSRLMLAFGQPLNDENVINCKVEGVSSKCHCCRCDPWRDAE